MVREAYNQGLSLVDGARKRKSKEMDALNVTTKLTPFEDPPNTVRSYRQSEPPEVDWGPMEMPFEWDWDVFLNPSLIMSTHQAIDGTNGDAMLFQNVDPKL